MGLFSSLTRLLSPAPPPDADVGHALKRIAHIVSSPLFTEPGFERVLAPRVRDAIDYCDGLVSQLPQALGIERAAFAAQPEIHALFGCASDIDALIGHSQALHDYFGAGAEIGNSDCYALLAARREEKSILGVEHEGDLIRTDVPQRLLHFSHHNLSLIADTRDQARARLREAAFDSLIKTFETHVHKLRDEQDELRKQRALAATRERFAMQHGTLTEDETRYSRTIASLDARLGKNASVLSPAYQLEALADFLADPAEALRLETIRLDVDRSGKILEHSTPATDGASRLELTELISRDRRRHVIQPVHFSRETALQALERTRRERARFIVI